VDTYYVASFGRRKSWLVPVQAICGVMMLGASGYINGWAGEDGGEPHVKTLSAYFFVLYLMMATQDIAVDGWALTMLSKANVGYASTCNTVGQTFGFFMAHVGFLALNDPGTCNRYIRTVPQEYGLISLGSFMHFWSIVFIATTLFVYLFKKEKLEKESPQGTLLESYHQLLNCIRLPSVSALCKALLTCRIAFAVTDAATTLKLVEYGMPKEELAMLSPVLVVLGMAIPIAVGRLTAGPRPLSVFLMGYPLRICVTLLYAAVLPLTSGAYADPDNVPKYFYAALLIASMLHEIASNFMYVSSMAFFAKISDPVIGGTYMTLLNTVSNLGSKW
ncbi:unnamed protein product, partial [Chrysoparadoxa australica]